MAPQPRRSQPHHVDDPWDKFTRRNDQAHEAEDWRLCSSQHSVSEIIKRFMERGYTRLTGPIPHQRRVLKEFLEETISKLPSGSARSIEIDVRHSVFSTGIAGLLEDRHDHTRCANIAGSRCTGEITCSGNMTASKLYDSLHEQRSSLDRMAERRVLFLPDLTSATAIVLASAVALRSTIPVRNMMHRYLTRDCIFSAATVRNHQSEPIHYNESTIF
ncbi:hypothetical protein P171DRAFT_234801 [Karstenula rhodostoma CBS 690.94]|uniref:Uncharacterized protein n=1 Tax=Karstenula rhodostoma CBS 690.94 TaxID=1392251 RepID=A0A9P4PPM5_9PLEO|nr:hypothetical protein P171DRAFT_234801 [Karstenula rhodostoma CBS 690.94]